MPPGLGREDSFCLQQRALQMVNNHVVVCECQLPRGFLE